MNAIEADQLSKTYRTRVKAAGLSASLRAFYRPVWRDVPAVRDISFTADQGEILAFIGPNGAGKSTTIKMMTGILHPSGGSPGIPVGLPDAGFWHGAVQRLVYLLLVDCFQPGRRRDRRL